MSRPGFVLDVDKSTPPSIFWRGERLTSERLPIGSRVVYAPESPITVESPYTAVDNAIENPVLGNPLRALLSPSTKLTVAFDDSLLPLLASDSIDPRRVAAEAVLEMASDIGVEDVELVVARGLRRRMTEAELRHALGDRVYESFAPRSWLRQHDAETAEELASIGKADDGSAIEINRRVAESDVVVYLGISLTSKDCGFAKIASALAGRKTLGDASPERLARIGSALDSATKLFLIESTVDVSQFPSGFEFLGRREREWRIRDKAAFLASREISMIAPSRFTRQTIRNTKSTHRITSVHAGDVDAVAKSVAARLVADRSTSVNGQTDVLVTGIPSFFPYGPTGISNPVLAANAALGLIFNLNEGVPVVRKGGVLIVHHPMRTDFDTVSHPSYIDFYEKVLGAGENADEAEERFAADPWFLKLYRESYAFHGAHPFHAWRECAPAREYLGAVIVIGGDPEAVRRLGFKPASTFEDALEMSTDVTGASQPSITQVHTPPIFTIDVK